MQKFTPAEFLRFLEEAERAVPVAQAEGLRAAGERFERDAKEELGHYQRDNMGPLTPWAELADLTRSERLKAGYTENDPGLASGAMQESVHHRVDGSTIVVGSDDPHAKFFEDGTLRQPPRPFLSLALWRHGRDETQQIARRVFGAVVGKRVG